MLGIKSNKIFFHYGVYRHTTEALSNKKEVVIYTRNYKQISLIQKKLKNKKGITFVFESHQILSINYCRKGEIRNAARYRKLEKSVLEHVDYIAAISKTLSDEIDSSFNISPDRRIILPVGVSEKFFNTHTTATEKKYDLIYSGGFSEWKGIDTVLSSLPNVIENHPNLKILFVGANEEQKNNYEKLVASYGISSNINIKGKIPHLVIPELLNKSKVGIIAGSYKEDGMLFTSPLKLYEYLASGISVVAPSIPSLMTALPDNLVHWAIPGQPDSYSQAILSALEDTSTTKSDKRIQYAMNFTWDKRALKLIDFLNHKTTTSD